MKKLFLTTALALFAAPALAEDTVWQWGCEWKYGENGDYLTKVDGGCKHWIGLGYATQAAYLKDAPVKPSDDDDDEGEDPGDGGDGEEPGDGGGDDNGPGTDPGNGSGPDKPGKGGGKGKGKGKGKGGKGKGRN